MGPTLSRLIRRGLRRFPNLTHGLLADADFAPASGLDRRRLGGTCSRATYRILSDGGAESRTSDWIYRNVPGVRPETREGLERGEGERRGREMRARGEGEGEGEREERGGRERGEGEGRERGTRERDEGSK